MGKVKPQRKTTIMSTIDVLKKEQEKVLSKKADITLVKIDNIKELKLENDTLMHNRISYSRIKLLDLADNIAKLAKEKAGVLGTGLLNPIMLRNNGGRLERIHGANRIKALKINGATEVPAIIMDNISDELARFMRSSENLNREDLNAYDETLSILEHIQLACNFSNIEEVKSFIIKIKNYQSGKTTLSKNEKELHSKVSDVFNRIGRFDIITFVDRLSVLKLHPLIKQALVDDVINYSQARIIKSKLKTESEISKILEILKNKKLSISELKTYIKNLLESYNPNASTQVNIIDNIKSLSKNINKTKYLKLESTKKDIVDKKLYEIEKLYKEINKTINI